MRSAFSLPLNAPCPGHYATVKLPSQRLRHHRRRSPCHTQLITWICVASHSDLTLPSISPASLSWVTSYSSLPGWDCAFLPSAQPSTRTLQADPVTRFPRRLGNAHSTVCPPPAPLLSSQPVPHPQNMTTLRWQDGDSLFCLASSSTADCACIPASASSAHKAPAPL